MKNIYRIRSTVWEQAEEIIADPSTPEANWAKDRLRGDLIAFASSRTQQGQSVTQGPLSYARLTRTSD